MNKLLVICGPTATGKTGLAVKLAKKFSSRGRPASGWNGELISADSRQVYRGMDIGTGKDHPKEMKIHLIDVVAPNQEFSVAQYVNLAWKVISDIWKRKKLPIIVGGTGFYIKGLIDGIETLGVPPDWELRKKLSNLDIKKLREILEKTCPERMREMNESDRNNPRRLIRAIEIASVGVPSQLHPASYTLNPLFIGLTTPYKTLYQQIDKRVIQRVKMGAEKEVRRLLKKGYSWDLPAMNSMGYIQWQPFFEGKVTKDEVIQRWKFTEHAYARRQMTWFKKDKRINWFDISLKGWENKVEDLVRKWYSKDNAKEN